MPHAAAHTAAAPLEDDLGPLQRLGDTVAWGELLIELLELNGWTIHRRRAFAGDGIILLATHPDGWDVEAAGPSVAAAATPLFVQAATIRPPQGDDLAFPV